ncbi:exo-alpha-(2-_3)-sialidase, partial [Branchiostoma belcheri]
RILYDKGISSYLGTVFVDDTTRTVFLMYTYCEFCPLISMMLMNSTDDGITWGRPRNITDMVGKDYAAYPGPGYGIQKKHEPAKGRLVVCGHGFQHGKGLVLLLSDDHGVTWRHGAFVPSVPFTNGTDGDFDPDECQPVELPDGSLYVVARNEKVYKQHCKIVMRSLMVEKRCHRSTRRNLYIRWSYDHGKTWSSEKQIWADWAGYSTLMMLPGDKSHLYIMYERGKTGPAVPRTHLAQTPTVRRPNAPVGLPLALAPRRLNLTVSGSALYDKHALKAQSPTTDQADLAILPKQTPGEKKRHSFLAGLRAATLWSCSNMRCD